MKLRVKKKIHRLEGGKKTYTGQFLVKWTV